MTGSDRIVTRAVETTRAARFADGIAARHAGDPGAWLRCAVRAAGVARVLLRRRSVVVAGAPANVTIAPRIELRLATSALRTGDAVRPGGRHLASVPRELPRTVSAPSAVPMLERASRRAVRDDAQASGPGGRVRRDLSPRSVPDIGPMPAGAQPTPPARVLRRRAPAVVPAPAPARDEPVVRAAGQPARPAPLSPVEINRLTDHIVQTIDRRIAAFRERQGRV
jgi:hypothetical protein